MPIYEFKCKQCGHQFDLIESFEERGQHKEKCPNCNSQDVERVFAPVNVKTSKKS